MGGRKRLLRVVAVLSVAVATGQAVETLRSNAALAKAADAPSSRQEALPASASLVQGGDSRLPDLRGITPVAAAAKPAPGDACTPSLTLTAKAGAMIDVALAAPCNAGERIVLRHAGISATAMITPDGRLALSLPALETDSLVAVYFEGSAIALATVEVPEAAHVTRLALQIPYPLQVKLKGEAADATAVAGSAAPAGRTMVLGSDAVIQPMLAQVYTFPGIDLGSARLSAEIRVSGQTCSRSFVADTRISQGGAVTAGTLLVRTPDCGATDGIMVLKNLVPDLTLAVPK
jgi:hypothetical protein